MAKKSMAELIYTAYLTGGEAIFTEGGVTYTFTPQGLKSYIEADAPTDHVTEDQLNERFSEAQRDAVDALEAPTVDYEDLAEVTQAVKAIIEALQAE